MVITTNPVVISTTSNTAVVDVQSAWFSKINWVQGVAGAAMLLTLFTGGKVNLDAGQQAAIVTTIGVVAGVATWIMRTWFNPTVPPSAVSGATTAAVVTGTTVVAPK